ncbi:MAG: M20/M25/M40 family metallo-hydrolase, partial [Calditrichaeota bacterium]
MKKLLKFFALLVLLIVAVTLFKTRTFKSVQIQAKAAQVRPLDQQILAGHLARALTYRTISYQDSAKFNPQPFLAFQAFLEQTFPLLHQHLQKEVVNRYSLLYTWPGSNPRLQPALLMAHQDVVPVGKETMNKWEYPAFAGQIEQGYVWGRGAMDDKASLIAICEAVEYLLKTGFQPQRTLYLAFGHDEEIGGAQGAVHIARLLQKRGLSLAYVLDEGGGMMDGMMPGIDRPVAMVG